MIRIGDKDRASLLAVGRSTGEKTDTSVATLVCLFARAAVAVVVASSRRVERLRDVVVVVEVGLGVAWGEERGLVRRGKG